MRIAVASSLFFATAVAFPVTSWSADCSKLKSKKAIRAFIESAKDTNPLVKSSFSALLEVSPCDVDKKDCAKAKRGKRKETVHVVRQGDNQRVHFTKGVHAPQCLVARGKRTFICAECSSRGNEQCRSFKASGQSTQVPGTNVDLADFERLASDDYEARCEPVAGKPDYLKIIATKKKGDSPYDEVVAFFQKEKEFIVTMNFMKSGALAKVYRFFPKYYTRFQGQWLSTALRIRTTRGDEKKFLNETTARVLKKKGGGLEIYADPKKDPRIKGPVNKMFATN